MSDLELNILESMGDIEGFGVEDIEMDNEYKEELENAELEIPEITSKATEYKDSDIGYDYMFVRKRQHAIINSLSKVIGQTEVLIKQSGYSDKVLNTYNSLANTYRASLKDMLALNSTYTRIASQREDKKEENEETQEEKSPSVFELLEKEGINAGSSIGTIEE